MTKLLSRKIALIIILLPLLSFLGFEYALAHPRFNPIAGTSLLSMRRFEGLVMPSYADYARGVLRGDFGEFRGIPITNVVWENLQRSLVLLLLAIAASALLGPLLGVLSISRRTRRIKPTSLAISTLFLSMPGFLLGVAAIGFIVYGTLSGIITSSPLPLSGYGMDAHLIMPVLVLASRPTFHIARITANLLEHELQQDYIQVAVSKGLGWTHIFWRHALPNILSSVVITIGQSTRLLISGLIIVETLFLWPGIGRLFMLDIGIRTDGRTPFEFFAHPELLAALAVVFGALLLLADLVASILALLLDPRQKQPVTAVARHD